MGAARECKTAHRRAEIIAIFQEDFANNEISAMIGHMNSVSIAGLKITMAMYAMR